LLDRDAGPRPSADDVAAADALGGDDLHLALYLLYELHYRSFHRVADELEWEPSLLAFRGRLESVFEAALREATRTGGSSPAQAGTEFRRMLDVDDGVSLSRYMAASGTLDQMREFAIHRSAYQLKEADPHTWALPRLDGDVKAALAEIQFDEYGLGDVTMMHSALFVDTLRALGLDSTYGAYVGQLPGCTLATVNLVTMLGLHRRLRGAAVGHLAVFEMTSVGPMGRYSLALARLGVDARARRFYDVHVVADAQHQRIAAERLVEGLARDAPDLVPDMLFGARAVLLLENAFASHLLDAWARGRSSLVGSGAVAA
jgi:hypothetical protein